MKKLLGYVLVFIVCVAFASVVVSATLPTYTPENDGTYSVPFSEGTSGSYYALLVVEGVYDETDTPVISEDTVLYIDQGTADANGDVSFDGWIPKNENAATVYLGGYGLDAPILLGYIGMSEFVVSGTISTDSGTSYEATITLTDDENNVFTGTSMNGMYAVQVPRGTYTFTVNVNNHLSYTDNDFKVQADVSGKDIAVKGGDVDENGVVDFDDLAQVLKDYNTASDDSDVDNKGTVDFEDLSVVLKNYTAVAVVE